MGLHLASIAAILIGGYLISRYTERKRKAKATSRISSTDSTCLITPIKEMTKTTLTPRQFCEQKEQELLTKYFSNLVQEAATERPETIGEYTQDLPLKIEAEYRAYLEELWSQVAPEPLRGTPLVLEEEKLRKLMTDDDREAIADAYRAATRRTIWERITQSNHKDVTYYKGLLQEYTRELLMVMREDFLEEVEGHEIKNKSF